MIVGTSYQHKLSRWKKIHTSTKDPDDLNNIVYKCWLSFSDQMEEANIAEHLEEPVWMNEDDVECEEGEAFDCKVTHRITRPGLALCVDEVGADTS